VLANVLVGDGRAWAVYRLETVSYPLLARSRKVELLHRVAALATTASSDLAIWRLAGTDDDAPAVYVAVRLDLPPLGTDRRHGAPGFWKLGWSGWKRSRQPRALRVLSVPLAQLRVLAERERAAHARVCASVDARRASAGEIARLTCALPRREAGGVPAESGVSFGEGCVHAAPCSSAAAAADVVDATPTRLEVLGAGAVSHCAVLSVGTLADGMEFPGRAELLSACLDELGASVDAAVHARWVSNALARRRAARTIVDAENVAGEQAQTGRVPDSRLASRLDTALDYKRHLESAQAPPMLRATLTLRVCAPTASLLDEAIERLAAAFAPTIVVRPRYVQRRLLEAFCVPGRAVSGVRSQPLTCEQLGALMPVGCEHAGTDSGPVIGRVPGVGRVVRLDLAAASRSSRPPSVLCVGTLGSGKTVTSQLVALHALRAGSLVVDVDPKPDHRLDQLDELAGRTSIVDLADVDRHQGLLDPLRISDPAMRDEVAASFYADLTSADARTRALIRATLADLPTGPTTSTELITRLGKRSEREARDAAEQLRAWSRSGLARLALGSADTEAGGADAASADLVSVRCRSLALPAASTPRDQYTDSERVSVAVMRLIAAYATRLLVGSAQRHKLLLIDEAWLLLCSSDGRALIERINRTGRSENATLLLATQQLADAEHVAPLIGTHLVFGLETAAEARLAAAALGMDDSGETVRLLTGQRAGRAVLRDTRGRLARVQIEPGAQLLDALSTTPTQGQAQP
jgi:hypothetical protein